MSESDDRTLSGEAPAKIEMIPVSRHEKNLRAMRCVVSLFPTVTLHHCHGGSMVDFGLEIPGAQPGMGERSNPFYQIPLWAKYHVGEFGIDTGMGEIKSVEQWEERFGTQMDHLKEINDALDYDIWFQAGMWWAENRK